MTTKLSIQDFNVRIKECKNKNTKQKLHAIYLYRIQKKPAKDVALRVHTSPGNIYQWAHRYKKLGFEGLMLKKKGGRQRQQLSLDEEKELLQEVLEDGKNGLIVIANSIQKKAAAKANGGVFKDYAYALLKRHGWRKVKPRPRNPKSSKEIQEAFKKSFPQLVQDAVKTFDQSDTRPLMALFEDEARFGRMTRPVHCWAPQGVRPSVACQLVRQFYYVYSVVCPATGKNYSLILSDTDTEMMNIFLAEVSKVYKEYRLIIIVDQASWHKSKTLKQFDNIRFVYLPPGRPELNAAEHIWDYVREKHFANRISPITKTA